MNDRMINITYTPNPLDTANITLPAEVLQLVERMAENTHDVWAAGRIAQGWTYGPVRDDVNKQHPCLVPYDQLPDSEKEYDRNTSIETLKLILASGYALVKVEQ